MVRALKLDKMNTFLQTSTLLDCLLSKSDAFHTIVIQVVAFSSMYLRVGHGSDVGVIKTSSSSRTRASDVLNVVLHSRMKALPMALHIHLGKLGSAL